MTHTPFLIKSTLKNLHVGNHIWSFGGIMTRLENQFSRILAFFDDLS
jgi:hypothetical protein